ncbi:TRAP-type C4-dicarboxylate transport system permease small subunit [Spinactinospora alkalitolerans]|uniref:TRAP-type C4-dicarboxylate transport system permease small subunit n=1 Tax=Spinactinospora alkalitolerans TaxID=687207 RepID=A0A852TUS8_9ACTN|nr:TRAP transporter small permease [Spinactinospora alkalitolerans]NYE48196.1 TRAP-type C4-dicarboxylate transport system permease small subunit [Spinactinospora alkalitolerans]
MSATPAPVPRRRHGLELCIEVPAVTVTFVMMLHITANALLRTFAQSPIPNTLEIVQYWYLPIVAFLGFIAAQHRGQHIAADLVYAMLPRPVRRAVLVGGCALCSVLSAGFAWFGWGEAVHAMEIGMTAGVSEVVSWPAYFLVPFAFGSLTVQFALAAARAIRHPEADRGAGGAGAVSADQEASSELEKK